MAHRLLISLVCLLFWMPDIVVEVVQAQESTVFRSAFFSSGSACNDAGSQISFRLSSFGFTSVQSENHLIQTDHQVGLKLLSPCSPFVATAFEEHIVAQIPVEIELSQNYPNPFNPSTNIIFSLPAPTRVRLSVFDLLGREVQRLVDTFLDAGIHEVEFNAGDLPSSTYLYRLETPLGVYIEKMLLLK